MPFHFSQGWVNIIFGIVVLIKPELLAWLIAFWLIITGLIQVGILRI